MIGKERLEDDMASFARGENTDRDVITRVLLNDNTHLTLAYLSPYSTPDQSWIHGKKYDAVGVASFGPIDAREGSPTWGYLTTGPKEDTSDTHTPEWVVGGYMVDCTEF